MKNMFIFVLTMMILLFGCTVGTQKTTTNEKNENIGSAEEHTGELGETAEEIAAEQQAIKEANPGAEKTATSEKIAGTTTPYMRYNEVDFNKARSEGKVIYMYFYATWCPICKKERPNILSAFAEMGFGDAIGFEVHFNDDETTQEDQEAARKYGISYQHTTIIFNKKGELVYRSLSPITEDEIISEITKAKNN